MKILAVPGCIQGQGTGHLQRMLDLVFKLDNEAFIYLDKDNIKDRGTASEVISSLGYSNANIKWIDSIDHREHWDLIILDRRQTNLSEFRNYSKLGLVAAIDEGGEAREYLPYLIDILPGREYSIKANITDISLLDLPDIESSFRYPFKKVLISFGGEDPANLSSSLLDSLLKSNLLHGKEINLVIGPLFKEKNWPDGIRLLRNCSDLSSILPDYDLIFTSYGLTCFEALASGAAVILLNPSRYHQRLSRFLRIPEIGVGKPDRKKLINLLTSPDKFAGLIEIKKRFVLKPRKALKDIIPTIKAVGNSTCPICNHEVNPVVARFSSRTYFICSGCRIYYLLSFSSEAKKYNTDYFNSEYREQYGKTYLQDFENIKAIAHRRLVMIKKVLPLKEKYNNSSFEKPKLLDVGCAYGPFLAAAAEQGFDALGLDISQEAVAYVNEELKLKALQADFEQSDNPAIQPQSLDVLTMWFVIEHIQKLDAVLKRVNRLLKKGGVFAFSTPNGSGISALKDPNGFLKAAPSDHFFIWRPAIVKKILDKYGLALEKIYITGHHPERFFRAGQKRNQGSFLEAKIRLFSIIAGLGDTFETIAVKTRELTENE
jgi:2-polyprenyl-3-methyl-5-hydroxy-6-metoxy-1,4-benzoquinol methylase